LASSSASNSACNLASASKASKVLAGVAVESDVEVPLGPVRWARSWFEMKVTSVLNLAWTERLIL
jgi:hypothetical protein